MQRQREKRTTLLLLLAGRPNIEQPGHERNVWQWPRGWGGVAYKGYMEALRDLSLGQERLSQLRASGYQIPMKIAG